MKSWIWTLSVVLILWGLLGNTGASLGQTRRYGVFDDYNDPRGINLLGVCQWGMGGVRTAMENQGGAIMFSPASMAWDTPPYISAEFDIRTTYARGSDSLAAESQTLFLPRWIGMTFSSGAWRFGVGYGVPYGHRLVYRFGGSKYEYSLAEHRVIVPVAWRMASHWAVGVSVGLTIATWRESMDGFKTDNSASGLGFVSAAHIQWMPRPDVILGIEAQPPLTISGDAKIYAISFTEDWKRPLEIRVGLQKKWRGFRAAADAYFRQYSSLDSWMVDRGVMSEDQLGAALGMEFPWIGANWRLGGQVETDPVDGTDRLSVIITTGLGWSLGGVDVQTAIVDSHSSSEKSLRATRFLVGFDILAPEPYDD